VKSRGHRKKRRNTGFVIPGAKAYSEKFIKRQNPRSADLDRDLPGA
jgi:hypothetical protein